MNYKNGLLLSNLFVLLLFFLFFLDASTPATPSPAKLKALYNSLDPSSISQHLAFYELYPESPDGQKALKDSWKLLSGSHEISKNRLPPLYAYQDAVQGVIALVNKPATQKLIHLNGSEIELIEKISYHLPNRRLKGHYVLQEEEVLTLPAEEIDLARGLLLSQIPPSHERLMQLQSYEAMLDLMALQILIRIPSTALPETKIRAINSFIFDEMGYRFPPHSLYAKDLDLYTFLPSVLDSRKGVCLGVSILYISLAQRLGLPLEVITPPGHIYVRYRNGDKIVNIETTARGVHIDSDQYLSVDTRALVERNIKEVIGLAHFNQASVYWHQGEYEKALASYQKALPYLPHDMLLKELMAYNYLFTGHKETAMSLLKEVENHLPDYSVCKQTVAEDYLLGLVDAEGIKPLFLQVDEHRDSILKKKDALLNVIEKYPHFRAGIFAAASAWLQLHRMSEALHLLEKYHALYPNDASAEYYLAQIYAERLDYPKAWLHLQLAEQIAESRKHYPKALKDLRKSLATHFPASNP